MEVFGSSYSAFSPISSFIPANILTPRFNAHDAVNMACIPDCVMWSEFEYPFKTQAICESEKGIEKERKEDEFPSDVAVLCDPIHVHVTFGRLSDIHYCNVVMVICYRSDSEILQPKSRAVLMRHLEHTMISQPGRLFIYGLLISPSSLLLIRCETMLPSWRQPLRLFHHSTHHSCPWRVLVLPPSLPPASLLLRHCSSITALTCWH